MVTDSWITSPTPAASAAPATAAEPSPRTRSFSRHARVDITAVWQAATDVAHWPSWDPHEQKARLDGPFAPGTTGWNKPRGAPAGNFTLTEVEPERRWSARAGIPFGSLRGTNRYEPLGN